MLLFMIGFQAIKLAVMLKTVFLFEREISITGGDAQPFDRVNFSECFTKK